MEDFEVPTAPVAVGACECDEEAKSVPVFEKMQLLIDQKERLLERARGRIGWEKLIEELWSSSSRLRSGPPAFCHWCNLPESEKLTETRWEKQMLASQVEAIKFFLVNNRPRRSPKRVRSPKTEKSGEAFVQRAPKGFRCCECDVEEDQLEPLWESIVCLIKQKDQLEESARGTGQWLVVQEDLQNTACNSNLKVNSACRLCHLPQLDIVIHAKEEKRVLAAQIDVLKFHLVNNRPRRSPRRPRLPKQGTLEAATGFAPPSEKKRCECNDEKKLTAIKEKIELLHNQSKTLEGRAKDRVGWDKVQSEMKVITSTFSSQKPSLCCLCNIPETDRVTDARIKKRILFAQVEAVKYFLVNNRPRNIRSPKKADNKAGSQTASAADTRKTQAGAVIPIPEKISKSQEAVATDATVDTLKAQSGAEALLMLATSSSTGLSIAGEGNEAAEEGLASPEELETLQVRDSKGTCGFPCRCNVSSAASKLKAKYKDLREQQKQLRKEALDRVQNTSLEDLEIYQPDDVAEDISSSCAECNGQEASKVTRLRQKIQKASNKIEVFKFILLKNQAPVPAEKQVEHPTDQPTAGSAQTQTRPLPLTKEGKEDAGLVEQSIKSVGPAVAPPKNEVCTIVGEGAMGDAPPKIAESKAQPSSEDGVMTPFTFNDVFEMNEAPQWMPETPPRGEQHVLTSDEASEMVPFAFSHEFEMDEAPRWMPDTPPENEVHEPSVASPMKEVEQELMIQTYGQPEPTLKAREAITMRESAAKALICFSRKNSDDILPAESTVEIAMHVDHEENDDIEKLEQEIEEILSKPEGMEMMAIEVERLESGTGATLEERGALSLEELMKEDGSEQKGVATGRGCGEKDDIDSAFADRGPIPPPAGLCSPRKSTSPLTDAAALWSLSVNYGNDAPESTTSCIEAAAKLPLDESGAGKDADTTSESQDSLVYSSVRASLSDSRKRKEVHASPTAALLHAPKVEKRSEASEGARSSTTDYALDATRASTIGQPSTPPPGKSKASTSTAIKDEESVPPSSRGSAVAHTLGLQGTVSVQDSDAEQSESFPLAGTPTQSIYLALPTTKQTAEAIQNEQAIANRLDDLILGVNRLNMNRAFPEQDVVHERDWKNERSSITDRIDDEDNTIQQSRQETVQAPSPSEGIAKLATEITKMNAITNPGKKHPLVESVSENVVPENTNSAHTRLESPQVQGNRSFIGLMPPSTSPSSMDEPDSVTAKVAVQLFNAVSETRKVLQVAEGRAARGETRITYCEPNVRAPNEACADLLESDSAIECQKKVARELPKDDECSELTTVVKRMHEEVELLRRMLDQESRARVHYQSKLRMLAPKYMSLRAEISRRMGEIAQLESAVERGREALVARKQDHKCRTEILRGRYRYWLCESHRLRKALENNQRRAMRTKGTESKLRGYAATVEAELVHERARVSELCDRAQNTSLTLQNLREALAKKHAQVQTLTRDLENLKLKKDEVIKRRNIKVRFIQDILKVRIKEKMALREACRDSKVLAQQCTEEAEELTLKLSATERTNEELRRRIGQLELRLAASKRRNKSSIRSKALSFCLLTEKATTSENTAGFGQPCSNNNFQAFLLALEETQKQLIESHFSSSVLLLATVVDQAKRYSASDQSECNEQERKAFHEAVTKAAQRGERREKAMQKKILEQALYRQEAEDRERKVKSLSAHMVEDVVDRLSHFVRLASPPSSFPEDKHDKMCQLKTHLNSIFQTLSQAGTPEQRLQSAVASTISNIFLEVEEIFVELSEASQENASRVQMLSHELAAAQRQKENMWAVVQDLSCVKQNIGSALSAISAAVQEQCQVKHVSRLFRDLATVFAAWYEQNEQSPVQPQEREQREGSLKRDVANIMAQFEEMCWPGVTSPGEHTSAAGATTRMSSRIPEASSKCSAQPSMPTSRVSDIFGAEVEISCSNDGVQGWRTKAVDVAPENAAGSFFGTAAEALVSSPGTVASKELPNFHNFLDDVCLEDDGVEDESDIVDILGAMSMTVECSKTCEQASTVYSSREYPESPSAILREIESLLDDSTEQDSCPTTGAAAEASYNSTFDVAPSSLLSNDEVPSQEQISVSAIPKSTIPAHQTQDLAVDSIKELGSAAPEHLHVDTQYQEKPKRQTYSENENQDRLAMGSEDILSAAVCRQSRINSNHLRPPSPVKVHKELMGMASEDILSTNQRLDQILSDLKKRVVELESALQDQCAAHSEAIRGMKEAHRKQIEGISTSFKILLDTKNSEDSSDSSSSQLLVPESKQMCEAEVEQGRTASQRPARSPIPCSQASTEADAKIQQSVKSDVLEGSRLSHIDQKVIPISAIAEAPSIMQQDEILPSRQRIAPIGAQSTMQRQLFPAAPHLVSETANREISIPPSRTEEAALKASRLLAPGFSRRTHYALRSFPSAPTPMRTQSQSKGNFTSNIPRLFSKKSSLTSTGRAGAGKPCSNLSNVSHSTVPSQIRRAPCGKPSPRPPFGSSSRRFASTKSTRSARAPYGSSSLKSLCGSSSPRLPSTITSQVARAPCGSLSPKPPFGSSSPRFPSTKPIQAAKAPRGRSLPQPPFGSSSLRFSSVQQSRLSHGALDNRGNHGKHSEMNDSPKNFPVNDSRRNAVHSPASSHPKCTAAFGSSSPPSGLPSKACHMASQKVAGPSKLTPTRRNIQKIQQFQGAQKGSHQITSRAKMASSSLHIATTSPTADVAADMQSPALTAQVKALEEKLAKVTKDLRKYQEYAGLFALKTKEFQTKYLAECERAEKAEQELTKSNEQRHRLAIKLFSTQCA